MVKSEILSKIATIDKGLKNPLVPESTKPSLEKKKAELQAELDKIESTEKAEKTKLEGQEKEVKDIDAILAKATSMVEKKQLINKKSKAKAKVEATKKEIKKVVTTKAPKVKSAIDSAKALLASLPKEVRAFNKGRSASELENDGRVKALKSGKRVSADGNVYYENRPNRSDANRSKRPYLEDGGVLDADKLGSYLVGEEVVWDDDNGIIDSVTIDTKDEHCNYLTVKFENGRYKNFIDKSNPKSKGINAYDISELELKQEFKKGGKLSNKDAYQNESQNGNYNEYDDAQKHNRAKPAGWRYTNAGAKRLGIDTPNTYVTKEHLEKYRGKTFTDRNGVEHRYIYIERREEKSDIKRGAPYLERGGAISGVLYSSHSNPLEYLIAMGAKPNSDLNYSTEKNGIDFYIGEKGGKAIVVAFADNEDGYMIDKEDAREMAETARTSGIESVELYTNYGIELHSKHESPKTVGFDKIYKVTSEFDKGGSIPNNYEGKTAEQVWDEWTIEQKEHFLADHSEKFKTAEFLLIDLDRPTTYHDIAKRYDYAELPHIVRYTLREHVGEGQYAKGGEVENEEQSFHKGDKIKKKSTGEKATVIKLNTSGNQLMESYVVETEDGKRCYWWASDMEVCYECGGRMMERGGYIKNQYQGKTAEEVWGQWTIAQRSHFLLDHVGRAKVEANANKEFENLPDSIKLELEFHVTEGQYEKGGTLNKYYVHHKTSPNSKAYHRLEKVMAKSEAEAIEKAKESYIKEWYEGEEKGREYTKDWVWEVYKYEGGGNMEDDNKEMVNIKAKEIHHHVSELKQALESKSEVPAWVVAKVERASTDLSDITHYLEGSEFKEGGIMYGKGGIVYSLNDIKTQIKAAQAHNNKGKFEFKKDNGKSILKFVANINWDKDVKEDIYPYVKVDYSNDEINVTKFYTENQLVELKEDLNKFQTDNDYIYKIEESAKMKWGGRTTFEEKVDAVAGSLDGKKVKPKCQKTYGKTYDKKEAMEAAKKIIGSRKAK